MLPTAGVPFTTGADVAVGGGTGCVAFDTLAFDVVDVDDPFPVNATTRNVCVPLLSVVVSSVLPSPLKTKGGTYSVQRAVPSIENVTRETRSVDTVAFQTTAPRRDCPLTIELETQYLECAESAGAAPAMTINERTSAAKSQKRRSWRRKGCIVALSATA